MPEMPRISIVTPSYNQAKFLENTIRSILNQDYPNLEYIIIDGGSTDGSVEIIRKYEKYLHYWVSEKDNGQANAINRGFAMCTGDVLNWINSDDRLKPGALKSVAEAVMANPDAGAWVGSCDWVNEKGKYLRTIKPRGLVKDKIAEWSMKSGYFYQPGCFLAKRAWDKSGPLDESLYTAFDLDLFIKIASNFKIVEIDAVLAEAAIHRDAKTQANIPLMRAERFVVQARHGYESLAIKNIERAEMIAMKVEKVLKLLKLGKRVLRKILNGGR